MVRIANYKGNADMSARFESLQRVAVSLIAALALSTLLFSTAASINPIA